MWAEIAAKRDEWVGGELRDYDMPTSPTTVRDVTFERDYFEVVGAAFTCGVREFASVAPMIGGGLEIIAPGLRFSIRGPGGE